MDPYGPWGLVCNLLLHMFFSASLPRELRGPEAPSSNGGQEADEWLGFSPTMTHALEEAYQTWLSEATRPSIAGLFGGGLAGIADIASSNSTKLRIFDSHAATLVYLHAWRAVCPIRFPVVPRICCARKEVGPFCQKTCNTWQSLSRTRWVRWWLAKPLDRMVRIPTEILIYLDHPWSLEKSMVVNRGIWGSMISSMICGLVLRRGKVWKGFHWAIGCRMTIQHSAFAAWVVSSRLL